MREMGYQSSKKNSQQPKEFRGGEKKVMKKRLALLLSVAMAFSMFANVAFGASSDLTTTQKYDALVKEGIFTGIAGSNDPQLNATTTRAQFAKVLALTLGLEPVNTGSSFKDQNYDKHWAKPYVEALVKENLITGYADGKFHFNDTVTGEQMAKTFGAALGLEEVKDAAAIEGVSKWAYGWVQAVKDAGFDWSENGKWNVPAKRATLVEASYDVREQTSVQVESAKAINENTVEVKFTDGETETVKLEKALVEGQETAVKVEHKGKTYEVKVTLQALAVEAKVTGATKLQLNLNRTVDTTKAKVEVKRGTSTVAVKEVKFADNKMAAEVQLSNRLVEGEYTVSVTGVSEKAATATFKAEAEKVEKIEFTSDKLAADETYSQVSVGVKITNQYGEDASKIANMDWKSTKGTVTESNGILKLTVNGEDKEFSYGETIVITGIEQSTYKVVTQTFQVGLPAKASDVEFKGVYHADNKTLNTHSTFSDFYILLEVKDQYGNTLSKDDAQNSLVVTSTNPSIAKVNKSLALSGSDNKTIAIQLENFTDEDYHTAGEVTINAITLGSGKTFSYTLKVDAASEVNKFNMSNPGVVASGDKDIEIPFTAYDQNGAEITDFDAIDSKVEIKASSGTAKLTYDAKNKKAKLLYTAAKRDSSSDTWTDVKAGQKDLVYAFVKGSNTTQQLFIDIKEKAVPSVVSGVSGTTNVALGGTLKLDKENIKLQDQYGRTFSWSDAYDAGYRVGMTEAAYKELTDRGYFTNVVANAIDPEDTEKPLKNESDVILLSNGSITLTAKNKGTQSLEFSLFNVQKDSKDNVEKWTQVRNSASNFNVTSLEKGAISEYKVDEVGTLWSAPKDWDASSAVGSTYYKAEDYTKSIVVKGKKSDGTEVILPASDYIILSTSSNIKVEGNKVKGQGDIDKDVKANVQIVINAAKDLDPIVQEVTVSPNAPAVKSLATTTDYKHADIVKVDGNFVEVKAGQNDTIEIGKILTALKGTDQYGVAKQVNGDVAIASVTKAPGAINHNGQEANKVTVVAKKGETFTVNFFVDGASILVNVAVQK